MALKFAAVEHIERIPRAFNEVIEDDIIFHEGYNWLDMDFIQESAEYKEDEGLDDDGDIYNKSLRCVINQASPAMQQSLKLLTRRKLIFLVISQNFYESGIPPILVGDLENWLTYTKDHDTGRAAADLNSYGLRFRGKSRFPSYFYTGNY